MKRKRTFRKIVCLPAVVGLVGMMGVWTSCHDDETIIESRQTSGVIENTERPTTDQLAVKYTKKAVVLGNDHTNFNASVVDRMDNYSNAVTSGATVYVFTKGSGAALTADEAADLLAAYASDASFVFINPETILTDNFVTSLKAGVERLEARGAATDEADGLIDQVENLKASAELSHREAIGVRKGAQYIVRKLEEMADSANENSTATGTDENGNEISAKCIAEDYTPTAYDYGLSADRLVTWLNGEDTDGSNGAQEQIDQLIGAEKHEFNFVLGPSRALEKTMSYSLVCRIYPAYDFDNDADYYFVRLNANFHPAELDCVRGTDKGWKKADKYVRLDDGSLAGYIWDHPKNYWYGPYMSKFDLRASITGYTSADHGGIFVENASPKTDVSGSSSHSSGFNFSLTGSVGLSAAGPQGGVSAGLKFSESHSHSEKDLKVVHSDYGGNLTQWTYTGVVPQVHLNYLGNFYHDEVANFQISDWQNEMTWIFKVVKPRKGLELTLCLKDITEIKELFMNIYDWELAVHPENTTYIKMPQPNRARKNYTMVCNDNNNGVQTHIEKALPETWKSGVFTYYGHTDSEIVANAKQWFLEDIKKAVLGINFGNINKDGVYTISLREQGVTGDVASFKIKLEGSQATAVD